MKYKLKRNKDKGKEKKTTEKDIPGRILYAI